MVTVIRKGKTIITTTGYARVSDFNGYIVYLDMYEADDDGNCNYTHEKRLTLAEVGRMMKEVDGKNHTVRWED